MNLNINLKFLGLGSFLCRMKLGICPDYLIEMYVIK